MIVKVKYKQSLFDITAENFGQIDNIVKVSNDNNISISDILETNQQIIINNENLGNEDIKTAILTQKISINNNVVTTIVITNKILENGDNKILEDGNNKILE
jgi:hypothetical protein